MNNNFLDTLSDISQECPDQSRKRNRNFRREMRRLKFNILKKSLLIGCKCGVSPTLEWRIVDGEYDQETGRYIRYSKRINTKRALKKQAIRKARYSKETFQTGKKYRRLYDLWWNLD